ncbi:uncharacterized protein ColSpa_12173 [Colletotrichum spaethianum]|uniref:LysM domain-containing protein n=1 Tax=Colletotrichum spaethianum TaxID=700344 RepID=A0AA37US54_9PEZI|nr:uncharacterized protein ColSpa_12173 [Colletotrichum spaethianum]GKT51992.1 hypothetical protein ColSpa_12173 [Colletotrichum spaethianum]
MICVFLRGGTYTGVVSHPAPTDPPIGDGFARVTVDPPDDAEVARGWTLNSVTWHVFEGADTCMTICVRGGNTSAPFRTVNPSLGGSGSCITALRPGTAVCVEPSYGWNITAAEPTSGSRLRMGMADLQGVSEAASLSESLATVATGNLIEKMQRHG